MKKTMTAAMAAAILALTVGTAAAHAPAGVSLGAGLVHPFNGVDHLLAMLAVGVWAAYRPAGNAPWRAPALFLLMLALGAGLGVAGTPLPFVETGIALSVALLGLMIVFVRRMPESFGLSAIAAFAVLHGHAHGAEAIGAAGLFVAGMLAASALLHGGGYVIGRMLVTRMARSAWLAGGVLTATGLALLGA